MGRPPSSPSPRPPPQGGPAQQRPPQQPSLGVTTYDTADGAATLVHVPRAVFTATVALGHHHLGDFYTPEGTLRSANDIRARVPRGRTVDTIWTWLRQHEAVLRPLVGTPPPPPPPPMATSPQDVGAKPNTASHHQGNHRRTGGQNHPGTGGVPPRQVHTGVMAIMGWSMVLPVCEQPHQDLPSDTQLHRLLVSLLDISTQAEPPLHVYLHAPLHVYLHDKQRVTTLAQLQDTGKGSHDGVAPQLA